MISFCQNLCLILFFIFLFAPESFAQNGYIVVEKFGGKRNRLVEGDEFHFKLKEEQALFNDVVIGFRDSTIIISSGLKIHIKDISQVYMPRNGYKAFRLSMQTVGMGFVVFPSLAYFTSKNKYSPRESIAIGATMIAAAQLLRLLPKWKRYKMNGNSRIWIME